MASTSTDDSDAESESTSGDESYFDEEGTEMEFEEDEDGESVNIDSILDITPVNSRSADVDVDVDDLAKASTSVASRASSVQSNDAGAKNLVVALSSSTPADVLNRDAFSSTSNDSDGSDPDNGTGAGNNIKERKKNFRETYSDKLQSPPQQSQQQPQSEWDKALLTGKESKGRASDFFLQQHPVASTDSLGLYSTLQAVRATTPGLTTQTNLPLTPKAGRSSPLPILRDQIDVSAPQTEDKPILPPPPRPQTHTSSHSNASAATISSQSVVRTGRGSTLVQVQTNMGGMTCHNHVPLQRSSSAATAASLSTASSGRIASFKPQDHFTTNSSHSTKGDLSAGVLPDVLMSMRQKIESMTLFDSDILRLTANSSRNSGTRYGDDDDPMVQESRESLKRSSQQSISAAVLVSLAHKRYERRRLAAMEIEKVVRSLVVLQNQNTNKPSNKNELDRVRAILLLLSDDYVRSTSEDARKGGVVALAACAIGLKKAHDHDPTVQECRDLILASVVHACQDHSQRVRYYATESLFNVVKGKRKIMF